MILYSWTALTERTPRVLVALGITDDWDLATRAGEESLGSGRAAVVVIEAVRPATTSPALAPCYTRTGVSWLGRSSGTGGVVWQRFFARGDPGEPRHPGRMGP